MTERAFPVVSAADTQRSIEPILVEIASPVHREATHRLVAESIVETAARDTRRRLTPAISTAPVKRVLDIFPYAIEFEARFRTKLMRPGFDLSAGKNLNDYWDLNLLSTSITHGLMRGNVRAQLVSEEAQLVAIAEGRGRQDLSRLRTYEAMIGVKGGA